jgi:hypothetical protein
MVGAVVTECKGDIRYLEIGFEEHLADNGYADACYFVVNGPFQYFHKFLIQDVSGDSHSFSDIVNLYGTFCILMDEMQRLTDQEVLDSNDAG